MPDENLLQRSVTTSVARNLTHTTKTAPKMMSITPRWLLSLLPWTQVDGGIYRVNRTKVELSKAERIWVDLAGGKPNFSPDALRGVPLFSQLTDAIIQRLADGFKPEEVSLGSKLIREGEDGNKFFVIAQGQVEGPCALNCTNGEEIGSATFPHPYYGSEGTAEAYAFHTGGAQFALGDGSVRFISESISIREFARLVTRGGGEISAQE